MRFDFLEKKKKTELYIKQNGFKYNEKDTKHCVIG